LLHNFLHNFLTPVDLVKELICTNWNNVTTNTLIYRSRL